MKWPTFLAATVGMLLLVVFAVASALLAMLIVGPAAGWWLFSVFIAGVTVGLVTTLCALDPRHH
jgi:hypothetical protein